MIKLPVGIAMYTIHRDIGDDLSATFSALREMGYDSLEFYGDPHSYDPKAVKEALAASGLALTGWHVEWSMLQPDRLEATLARLGAAGCPAAIVSCLGGKWEVNHSHAEECREIWEGYARRMNELAPILESAGMRLGYHSHNHEFELNYDGKRVHDILFEALSPSVIIELDSGCCIQGGGNPAQVIRKNAGRDMFLHLKPYSHTRGFDIVLGDPDDAHDWPEILGALDDHCLGLLVENGSERYDGLELAQRCLSGLRPYLA
ncbi:MAG: sugar phosphate isomerase/epimerase family protein [Oscillospiraceae bacterium]